MLIEASSQDKGNTSFFPLPHSRVRLEIFILQTYTFVRERKFSYTDLSNHIRTEPFGNVRITSPSLSKNIPPCATVSLI